MLARSLSEKQKLSYSVSASLKALIKNEMKLRGLDAFTSYHLKTSVFFGFSRRKELSPGARTA